jgi:hypothetical protein
VSHERDRQLVRLVEDPLGATFRPSRCGLRRGANRPDQLWALAAVQQRPIPDVTS